MATRVDWLSKETTICLSSTKEKDMVHGRRNFGPAPKHKPDEVKEAARKSAREAANERISATRGGPPHESGGEADLKRELETEHDGHYQRRVQRRARKESERS